MKLKQNKPPIQEISHFTINILGTHHSFIQNKNETLLSFKKRMQDYLDKHKINIEVI